MPSNLVNQLMGVSESMFMKSPRLSGGATVARAQRTPLRKASKPHQPTEREREDMPAPKSQQISP